MAETTGFPATGLCPHHDPKHPHASCVPCRQGQSTAFLERCRDGDHGLVRLSDVLEDNDLDPPPGGWGLRWGAELGSSLVDDAWLRHTALELLAWRNGELSHA